MRVRGWNGDLRERFEKKYIAEPNTGCWLWIANLTPNGYAQIRRDSPIGGGRGKKLYAHRVSYEMFVGPIPEGLHLDHKCRVRSCVNPDHLEAVTHQENVRRGEMAQGTHCKHGHLFDEANTYWRPRGGRTCKTCNRRVGRAYDKIRHSRRSANVIQSR